MRKTDLVSIGPSSQGGDPQEDYAYAFMRVEHECLTATGYWKKGFGCEADPFRSALEIFFSQSLSFMDTLGGSKLDKKLRRRLVRVRLQAARILKLLGEIEQLPLGQNDDAEFIMGQMFLCLTLIKLKIQPMLPDISPYLGHEDLTASIRQRRGFA